MSTQTHPLTPEDQARYFRQMYEQQTTRNDTLQRINDDLTNMLNQRNSQQKQTQNQIRLRHKKQYLQLQTIHGLELQTFRDKMAVLQQSRTTLQDEINILKRQISEKDAKIAFLQQAITNHHQQLFRASQIPQGSQDILNLKAQHIEDQQTIQILQQDLEKHVRKLSVFELKEKQLGNHQQLQTKELETLKIELDYYKQENEELNCRIKEVSEQLQHFQVQKAEEFQFQVERWMKIQQNLLSRIEGLEKNGSKYQNREDKIHRDLQVKGQQLEKEKQKTKDLQMHLNWYKKLLEETKSQFINAELEQEDKNSKLKVERNQLLKETQRLKKQMTKDCSKLLLNSRKTAYYGKNSTNNKSIISLLDKTPEKGILSSKSRKSFQGTARRN